MFKPSPKRYQILEFIQEKFVPVQNVDANRVFELNKKPVKEGFVIYLMDREQRLEDNWGLVFAFEKAKEFNKNLKIIFYIDKSKISKRQFEFIKPNFEFLKINAEKNNLSFEIIEKNLIQKLNNEAGLVITDFNPINPKTDLIKNLNCKSFEVDSHNIIPARFISDKQEYSAATLRTKIYQHIGKFLTEYSPLFKTPKNKARKVLDEFIENKLEFYSEQKNDPTKDVTSNLSIYLHSGQISSQRIALEVIKSNHSKVNKESFLEELITRKELADNFCLYNPNFNNFKGAPKWAQENLIKHKADFRVYCYDLKTFEEASTHEELWNAAQKQLLNEGKIHGYLRMYWAKKILEWSETPEEALKTAIYLNDKYAVDGNDPNGYVGILWSVGGLHDRPFFEREIFGQIRYMNYAGCTRKFDVKKYIRKFNQII